MREAESPGPDAPPIWEYVSPGDHRTPSAPVEHAVRTGLATFWRRIRPAALPSYDTFRIGEEVEDVSDALIANLAPVPGWEDAATALDAALTGWLANPRPEPPAVLVIGHPHGGNADILRTWATRRAWRLARPPEPAQILDQRLEWLDDLSTGGSDWVLPSLERCYLRHPHGLTMVRRLLDRVCSGTLGRVILGCDAWAWVYLKHLWQGQALPMLVAQTFDSDRLGAWLAFPLVGHRPTVFRQSDNGRFIWLPADAPEPRQVSDFLRDLAAHSRGIPGVAWAWWRQSLLGTTSQLGAAPAAVDISEDRQTVWVRPWHQVKVLSVPADGLQKAGLVLHALLLHDGLADDVSPEVLPLSPGDIAQVLSRLQGSGLVERHEGRHRVTALGYPAVRQVVAALGYLTA